MSRFAHRVIASVGAITAIIAITVSGPSLVAQASGPNPVVLVHGYWGDDWNWSVMVGRLRGDGWPDANLFVWDYNIAQSNVTTANQLKTYIDGVLASTGASKVDLVTHSMGGLSSRYYLKFLDGTSKVDEWVSLGGPNHGTNAAYLCWDASCEEMRYDSEFLTNVNSGDETPGDVRYSTVRSYCDEIINPDSSTILSGADNRELSHCVGHVSLLGSWEAYTTVRDFIR